MEKKHTKKLKIILNSKTFYLILIIIGLIYVGYRENFNKYESIYKEDTTIFELYVHNKKISGNKVTLELNGVENLVGSFYIDSSEELNKLDKELKYGVKVRVLGNLNKPSNNTIPNNFNYKDYLKYKGIYYTLNIDNIEVIDNNTNFIYSIKNYMNERITKIDNTGYMKAFVLGDKSLIDSTIYNNYQKIGVTHLFALSGMHVGLLSGIILFILRKLKDKYKYLILDFILIIYGFIVGFPSSIKRCILFFILNSINKVFKINLSPLKILILVIVILIINDYRIIFDVGFRYSIATVSGIILANNYISDESKIRSSFKLSMVAFLFSLPISLSNFYEVNLLSIFYNMIFVPFVSLLVYPLSLLTFILPVLSPLFSMAINVLETVGSFLSKIDILNIYLSLNTLEIMIIYLLLFWAFCKKYKKILILIPVIIIVDILSPYFDNHGYIYFFDIGQGDSSLVISPNRKDIILIDTGGIVNYGSSSNEYMVSDGIITFLKSKGIKSIDLLILSHGDADHAKETENILKEINIKNIKINPGNIGYYEQKALDLIKGRDYTPQNLSLNYLNYKDYNDENANSLLTTIKIYNTSILSFGDATKEAEEDLIRKYNLKNIDIAKISHHGSKTSSSQKYLSIINPKIAVISSGRNNRFKHPNQETIDNLNSLNIKYLNTQDSGTIEFIINKNNVTYNEYKP